MAGKSKLERPSLREVGFAAGLTTAKYHRELCQTAGHVDPADVEELYKGIALGVLTAASLDLSCRRASAMADDIASTLFETARKTVKAPWPAPDKEKS